MFHDRLGWGDLNDDLIDDLNDEFEVENIFYVELFYDFNNLHKKYENFILKNCTFKMKVPNLRKELE